MKGCPLTIGMAAHRDFDGVYFTICAARLYQDLPENTEFLVIDNCPNSPDGEATKKFVESINGSYFPYTERESTAVRDQVFLRARGVHTICLDSHVMMEQGEVSKLMDYYEKNPGCKNIVSGALLYDQYYDNGKCHLAGTHFDPVWREAMYGFWKVDQESYDKGEPFEIPMQGLGAFSCMTQHFPGFNENFFGFGGEEGYIHEKFRMNGGKAICLPGFAWLHRFPRPKGVAYNLTIESRINNYFCGWLELKRDPNDPFIKDIWHHFVEYTGDEDMVNKVFVASKAKYGMK